MCKGWANLETDLIEEFMQSDKVVSADIRWIHPASTDTAQCKLPVFVLSRPSFNAQLCLTVHVSRLPEKYDSHFFWAAIESVLWT